MKQLGLLGILLIIVVLCSCSTKRTITQERITSKIEYVPTVKRVELPQIKGNYKINNIRGLDTIINSKNLSIRLQIQDSIIEINSVLKDSIDIVTYDKVITNDTVRESHTTKRSSNIMLVFFLFLFLVLFFRFR